MALPLSPESQERVELLFPPELQPRVRVLLEEECGDHLPMLKHVDAVAIDRFRFAALKLSDGDLPKLERAIKLAKRDWRDLLVAAGFAYSVTAHRSWRPEKRW